MVKLRATVSCHSPTSSKLHVSFLANPSECRWCCLCDATVSKKYCVFPITPSLLRQILQMALRAFPSNKLSLSLQCPWNIFSSSPTSANAFLLHSHLQIPSSILLVVSAFSVAFPHFHPPSFPLARSTLSPSFSTYLCVCACGTQALVVIFQAAAQKIGLS